MSNKLKQIFNDDAPIIGKISFENEQSLRKFYDALAKVSADGSKVSVEGVKSIACQIKSGTGRITLSEQENLMDFSISPTMREIEYSIDINGEKIKLSLMSCMVSDGLMIETPEEAVIKTKILFNTKEHRAKIELHPDVSKATSIENIIMWAQISEQLLRKMFVKGKHGYDKGLENIFETLSVFRTMFEDAAYLEGKLNIKFDIKKIDLDDKQSIESIYELCLILRDKKAIRVAAKLTATESTGFRTNDNQEIKIGEPVVVTFTGDSECLVWGKKIKLFCVYMLNNALIKSVTELENGEIKVAYGDTDVAPMYYSYKGFIDKNEAEMERQEIMKHEEEYKKAKTIYQYMNEEA